MANGNNQAVVFSNIRLRQAADEFHSAYLTAKRLIRDWESQGLAAVIPDDTVNIADGAVQDGRPIMTNHKANDLINRAYELINWLETGQLVNGGTVTHANLNSVANISVNPQARF